MEKKYFFLLRTWLCAGAVLGLADAELGRQLGPQQQRLGRVQGLQGRKIFNIYHKNICCPYLRAALLLGLGVEGVEGVEAAADELAGRRGGGGRHQALAEHGGRLVHALLGPGVVKMVIYLTFYSN